MTFTPAPHFVPSDPQDWFGTASQLVATAVVEGWAETLVRAVEVDPDMARPLGFPNHVLHSPDDAPPDLLEALVELRCAATHQCLTSARSYDDHTELAVMLMHPDPQIRGLFLLFGPPEFAPGFGRLDVVEGLVFSDATPGLVLWGSNQPNDLITEGTLVFDNIADHLARTAALGALVAHVEIQPPDFED